MCLKLSNPRQKNTIPLWRTLRERTLAIAERLTFKQDKTAAELKLLKLVVALIEDIVTDGYAKIELLYGVQIRWVESKLSTKINIIMTPVQELYGAIISICLF
jgi:hypothetical protein